MPHLNCSVPLCVASTRRTPNLRFYRLPKEPAKRERWLRLIRNDSLVTRQTVSQWTSVCSLHFTEIPSLIIPECHEPEIFPWCPEWPDIIRAYNDEVTSNNSVSIAPLPILTPENTGTNWPTGLSTGVEHSHQDDSHSVDGQNDQGHSDTGGQMIADSSQAHQSDSNKRRKTAHTLRAINGNRADEQSTDSDLYIAVSKKNDYYTSTGSLIMTVDGDRPSIRHHVKANTEAMLSSAGNTFPLCELTYAPAVAVTPAEPSIADKTYYNPYHSPQVMSRLCELWRLGQLCDAILCVGNTVRMNAHRVVLAAVSPYVLGLCGTPHIGPSMEIKLPSGLNIEAVHKVLTYMYEGCLSINQVDVKAIWKVALLLKIDAIIGFCEEYMRLTNYLNTSEAGEQSLAHRKRKYVESHTSSAAASIVGPLISGGYLSKAGQSMPIFMPLKKDHIKMHGASDTNEVLMTSRSLKQSSKSHDALDLAEIPAKPHGQRLFSSLHRKISQAPNTADALAKRKEAAKNLDRILSRNTGLKKEMVKSLNTSRDNSPSPPSNISKAALASAISLLPLMGSDASNENSNSPAVDRYYSSLADDEAVLDMNASKEDSGDDQMDDNNREDSDGLMEDTWQPSDNENDVTDRAEDTYTAIKIKQEVMDGYHGIDHGQRGASPMFMDQRVNRRRINRDSDLEKDDDRCISPSLQLPNADDIQVPDQLLVKLEPDDAIDDEPQPDITFPSFIVDEQAVVPDRLFASASLAASITAAAKITEAENRMAALTEQPKWVTLSSRRAPRKYKLPTASANSVYQDVLSMSPASRGMIIENLPVPDEFLNSSNPEQQRRYMASCLERGNVSLIPEKNRQYRCSFCPSFFIKAKSCVGHVVETHDVLAKDVLNYISIANRKPDQQILPVSAEKDVPSNHCDECNFKAGQTADALDYHKHVRHGTPLPPGITMHKCHACDKEFTTKYYWRQHLLMHEGMEQYVCEICGQGFRTSQLLRQHTNKIHPIQRSVSPAVTKSYFKECDECGEVFHHLKSYQSHVRAHEREMLTLLSESTTRHDTRDIGLDRHTDKDDDDDCVDEEKNSFYKKHKQVFVSNTDDDSV